MTPVVDLPNPRRTARVAARGNAGVAARQHPPLCREHVGRLSPYRNGPQEPLPDDDGREGGGRMISHKKTGLAMAAFAKDLQSLNRHGIDNITGTPDFILTDFVIAALDCQAQVIQRRDRWLPVEPTAAAVGLANPPPPSGSVWHPAPHQTARLLHSGRGSPRKWVHVHVARAGPECEVTRRRRAKSPAFVLPAEIERQVKTNFADRDLRDRIRYELRAYFASWGISRAEIANILEGEACLLRADDEADRARDRAKARGR